MTRLLAGISIMIMTVGSVALGARASQFYERRVAAAAPTIPSPRSMATTSSTSVSAQDDEAIKEQQIRLLMKLTGSAKLGDQLLGPALEQLRANVGTAVPQNRRQQFMDEFSEKFRARFNGDDIVNAVIPIYARYFSLAEIQGLVQFYESPLGHRFVTVLPQLSQESQTVGIKIGQKALLDTLREMSSEYPDLNKLLGTEDGATVTGPTPTSNANQK
jgi:uncharacterized protein